jgi:hypothetical protein
MSPSFDSLVVVFRSKLSENEARMAESLITELKLREIERLAQAKQINDLTEEARATELKLRGLKLALDQEIERICNKSWPLCLAADIAERLDTILNGPKDKGPSQWIKFVSPFSKWWAKWKF